MTKWRTHCRWLGLTPIWLCVSSNHALWFCVLSACLPGACRATGRGLQASGMRVQQVGDFKVDTRNAGSGELKVVVKDASEWKHLCARTDLQHLDWFWKRGRLHIGGRSRPFVLRFYRQWCTADDPTWHTTVHLTYILVNNFEHEQLLTPIISPADQGGKVTLNTTDNHSG